MSLPSFFDQSFLENVALNIFLNNQSDALIIKIYSVIKLYMFRAFSAHHQEFSTIQSALVSIMQVFDDRFQAKSGWNCSFLTLLGSGHQNLHETYHCRFYSGELLMMGRECPKHIEFYNRINFDN